MVYSVHDIATALGVEACGDTSLPVARVAEPASAGPDDLALATDEKYADGLKSGKARVAISWES